MRYIYLLLVAFIFTACGNNKLRFVRTNSTKQKVVEIAEIPSLKTKKQAAFTPENRQTVSEKNLHSDEQVLESDEIHSEATPLFEDASSFPQITQDSTALSDEEVKAITKNALRAQKNGTRSLIFSIAMYLCVLLAIGVLVIGIFPFSSIDGIIVAALAILTLLFWVLGIVFGISSLSSRYNTRKGRIFAQIGLILAGIALAVALINIFVF